jgi:hypothetical protein
MWGGLLGRSALLLLSYNQLSALPASGKHAPRDFPRKTRRLRDPPGKLARRESQSPWAELSRVPHVCPALQPGRACCCNLHVDHAMLAPDQIDARPSQPEGQLDDEADYQTACQSARTVAVNGGRGCPIAASGPSTTQVDRRWHGKGRQRHCRPAERRSRPPPLRSAPLGPDRGAVHRKRRIRVGWAASDVLIHSTGVQLIHHLIIGDFDLSFELFRLAGDPGQMLVT